MTKTAAGVPDRSGDYRRRPQALNNYQDPKTCKHSGYGGATDRDKIVGCPNCNPAARSISQSIGRLFG